MKQNLQSGYKRLAYFLAIGLSFFLSNHSIAQSIVVNSVSGPGCASNAITITFTTTSGNGNPSRYDNATIFTAYLSSATGTAPWSVITSFTMPNPPTIFTGGNNGITSGIQKSITLPSVVAGTGYKISIGSTSPNFTGSAGAGASPAFTISTSVTPGTVSSNQTICSGTQPANLTLSGNSANVLRWESSTSAAFTTPTTIANTSTTLTGATIGNLTATRYFRAVVSNGCVANTTAVTITVNPSSVGGTILGSTSVCATSNSGTLTLSGQSGTITKWQSATLSNFSNAVDIANNTTSQSFSNLTTTTYYRAVITNGSCPAANSAIATVTVDAAPVGGSVAGSTTVCSGINSGSLSLSGYSGTIVKWQSCDLSNFSAGVLDIPNASPNLGFSNLSGTTYYRAVISNGVCNPVNSSVATITVDAAPIGGAVSGSTSVCSGVNSGSLTLSGYAGTIVKWQSCDLNDFSAGVLDIPNVSPNIGYTNLVGTTYFRAVISNGVCNHVNSSVATITVDAAPNGRTINGNISVCYANNSGSLSVSGFSGTITGWELSTDNFATAGSTINNLTDTQFYNNLTTTTYYRAIISSGTCTSAYSPIGIVTIVNSTVWTGANGTSWTDAGNWSCGVVPTVVIDVTIAATANLPVISGNVNLRSLTMATATTLVVPSGFNMTVIDAIDIQGTGSLTVENNANLVQINDVDNSGDIYVERNGNPLKRLDYTLWSSPVTGQNLLDFSSSTVETRFYVYDSSLDQYSAVDPSATDFAEGTGYLIRMPDNHPTTPTIWEGIFTGEANNGDVTIGVANDTYNAVGNPYPSTIDADTFIGDNGIIEALYFWRKTNNAATTSYATYTLAGGAGTESNEGDPLGLIPNGTIQVGQGFIAKSTSTQLVFNNEMRIADNNDQFFRASAITERHRVWLNLTNAAGVFSQTMVSYMTGATQGLDAAIDGRFFNDSQTALTSIISGEEFAIQGRALPFEATDVVPMGFKTELAGDFSISIAQTDGLFETGQLIYLKDNLLNVTHDLTAGAYTFASEAGVFNNRFEVIYQLPLATNTPLFNDNSVVVYKQGEGFVINSGASTMKNVEVFDIRGRLLVNQKAVNAVTTKFTAGTANQVLIVKITSDSGATVTKKVVN